MRKDSAKVTLEGANPFLNFKLVTLPAAPPVGLNDAEVWPMFCDSVAFCGLQPALGKLNEKRRGRYRKWLLKHKVEWWQPEEFWKNWPEYLETSKLLDVQYWKQYTP